jgi:hypothetical protein
VTLNPVTLTLEKDFLLQQHNNMAHTDSELSKLKKESWWPDMKEAIEARNTRLGDGSAGESFRVMLILQEAKVLVEPSVERNGLDVCLPGDRVLLFTVNDSPIIYSKSTVYFIPPWRRQCCPPQDCFRNTPRPPDRPWAVLLKNSRLF